MLPIRTTEIAPDGVRILIPWGDILLGESIFIPCIRVDKCQRQVDSAADQFAMTFVGRVRIENGMLGLRLWRTT